MGTYIAEIMQKIYPNYTISYCDHYNKENETCYDCIQLVTADYNHFNINISFVFLLKFQYVKFSDDISLSPYVCDDSKSYPMFI